jgi:hypothetical protein
MLSRLDDIIYPNRCEVIEIEASQRYIYPIFKNGSTSIIEYANQQKYRRLINEQIQKISTIDVVLRDPTSRFISGLNTFVSDTKQNNPYLDTDTIIYFAENYLFLNRHYSPQLGWLINIKRYMGTTAKFRLHDMSALSQFTLLSVNPTKNNLLNTETIERLKTNIHNEMYIRLDSLLLQLAGAEMTFLDIMTYLHDQDPVAYSKLSCIALD